MSKYRIMVVDDDADVRFVVSALLSKDFEIVQASNGLDALEKYERYEPDLLLLDIMMPVMNGFACCQTIRRREEGGALPVFFLSAASSEAFREEAERSGASGFIEKPFDTQDVVGRIRGFLFDRRIPPSMKLFTLRELERIDATPLRRAGSQQDTSEEELRRTTEIRLDGILAPTEHPESLPATERPADTGRRRRIFGKMPGEAAAHAPAEPPARPKPLEPERDHASGEFSYKPQAQPYVPSAGRPVSTSSEFVERPEVHTPRPSDSRVPGVTDSKSLPKLPELARDVAPLRPSARDAAPKAPEPLPRTTIFPTAPPPPLAPPATPPLARPAGELRPTAPPPPARPAAPTPGSAETQSDARELIRQRRTRGMGQLGPAAEAPRPRVLVLVEAPDWLPIAAEATRGLAEFLPLEDPVEAVELIVRFQPDIVVLGVRGAKYSGVELGKILRESARLSHTELVYLTGYHTTPADANAAMRLSGNKLIELPLRAAPLRQALEAVAAKPGFSIRQKDLGYNAYVTEVVRRADEERAKHNKDLEREAYRKKTEGLYSFMARELNDYSPPVDPSKVQPPRG
ncbi:MAG: response regulator [Candidatus Sumerlaeia bacterium]|nr:response regulator [Candidatus Sumerlaeia bacterium]